MRKFSLIAAAAIGVLSFGLLTGFDSAASVDDILAKSAEASKNVASCSADVDLAANVKLEVPEMEMSLGVSASGTMDVEASMDPFGASNTMTMDVSMAGQKLNMAIDMYMVAEEDGSLGLYLRQSDSENEGTWEYTSSDSEIDLNEILAKAKDMSIDFSTLPIDFAMADAPVTVNGKECYSLSTAMRIPEMIALVKELAGKASQMTGEEIDLSELDSLEDSLGGMLDGVIVNFELDIATDDYIPMKFRLDLNGTDWTAIAPLIAMAMDLTDDEGNLYNLNIGVDDLYLEGIYDYAPVTITVPAEALAAKTSGSEPEVAAG